MENEKIKEILLCKYGELILKGANRGFFEDKLCKVGMMFPVTA